MRGSSAGPAFPSWFVSTDPTTALVHELYLKLLSQKKVAYEDRLHFYTFAAKVMRRILIDHARGNQAQMRGGGCVHVPLSDDLPWVDVGSEDLLELNRALDELNIADPYKVQLVELRYFLGCTGSALGRGQSLEGDQLA